jgi:hypothetical protein
MTILRSVGSSSIPALRRVAYSRAAKDMTDFRADLKNGRRCTFGRRHLFFQEYRWKDKFGRFNVNVIGTVHHDTVRMIWCFILTALSEYIWTVAFQRERCSPVGVLAHILAQSEDRAERTESLANPLEWLSLRPVLESIVGRGSARNAELTGTLSSHAILKQSQPFCKRSGFAV